MKRTTKTFLLLGVYFILLIADLLFNVVAIFVPSLGAVGETLTELVIEFTSLIIVFILAFGGKK